MSIHARRRERENEARITKARQDYLDLGELTDELCDSLWMREPKARRQTLVNWYGSDGARIASKVFEEWRLRQTMWKA